MWIRTILWKTALLWSNIQRHDISDGTLKSALFQRSCHAGLHFAPTFIGLIAILSNGVIVMPQSTLTTIYIYHNSFLVSFTIQNCLKPYSQTTDNVHTFSYNPQVLVRQLWQKCFLPAIRFLDYAWKWLELSCWREGQRTSGYMPQWRKYIGTIEGSAQPVTSDNTRDGKTNRLALLATDG